MTFRLNYLIIPAITIVVAVLGSQITGRGMNWYDSIKLPRLAPPGYIIGMVWTLIFILSTIAALWFYNSYHSNLVLGLLIANAVLNLLWTVIFFAGHNPGAAFIELIILNLLNLALIISLWSFNIGPALLWLPYFLWVCFAGYLNFAIWRLNA